MKVLNRVFSIVLFFIVGEFFISCNYNSSFDKNEWLFVKPFNKNDTAVYRSAKGQMDTIIFYAVVEDTVKVRNIEQGFYNNNRLRVGYALTKNSFHKFLIESINKEPEYFIIFSKAKYSSSFKQVSFLGLLFDDDNLKLITKPYDTAIVFSKKDAKYSGQNINEGINSFNFNFNVGIISFIDKHNVAWIKIK